MYKFYCEDKPFNGKDAGLARAKVLVNKKLNDSVIKGLLKYVSYVPANCNIKALLIKPKEEFTKYDEIIALQYIEDKKMVIILEKYLNNYNNCSEEERLEVTYLAHNFTIENFVMRKSTNEELTKINATLKRFNLMNGKELNEVINELNSKSMQERTISEDYLLYNAKKIVNDRIMKDASEVLKEQERLQEIRQSMSKVN